MGDTLFDMKFPSPVYHYPVDFRSNWQDLTWSLDDTDLSEGEVVQNEVDGINEGTSVWLFYFGEGR